MNNGYTSAGGRLVNSEKGALEFTCLTPIDDNEVKEPYIWIQIYERREGSVGFGDKIFDGSLAKLIKTVEKAKRWDDLVPHLPKTE